MSLLLVVGYGPGISHATAERFGREGYAVALVARNGARLAEGVARLIAQGITAAAFPADATDLASVRLAVDEATSQLGAPSALLWTAFRSGDVRDALLTAPSDIERVFDLGVRGLLATVQQILPGLKDADDAAVLVANGALGEASTPADALATRLDSDGVALENAAKTKLVGILAERLRGFGIYVGEMTLAGSVAGTATATPTPTATEPSSIAETFWSMSRRRSETRVRVSE